MPASGFHAQPKKQRERSEQRCGRSRTRLTFDVGLLQVARVVTARGREGKEKEMKGRKQHQHQKAGDRIEASSKREKTRKKDKTKEIQTLVVEPKINFGGAQPCQRMWIDPKEILTRRGVTEPRVYWEASQPSPDKHTLLTKAFPSTWGRGGSCKTGVIILYSLWPPVGWESKTRRAVVLLRLLPTADDV